MTISKFDLLFDPVTYLFEVWSRKTISMVFVSDYICGPSLVMIGKKTVTCIVGQTRKQTDEKATEDCEHAKIYQQQLGKFSNTVNWLDTNHNSKEGTIPLVTLV